MKRHPEGHAPNAPSPPGAGSVPVAQLLTALLRVSGAQTSIPERAVCPKGRSLQKEAERKSPRQLDLHSHEVSFLPQSKKKKRFWRSSVGDRIRWRQQKSLSRFPPNAKTFPRFQDSAGPGGHVTRRLTWSHVMEGAAGSPSCWCAEAHVQSSSASVSVSAQAERVEAIGSSGSSAAGAAGDAGAAGAAGPLRNPQEKPPPLHPQTSCPRLDDCRHQLK